MKLKTRLLIDYYVGGLTHALLKPVVIFLGRVLRRDHALEKCEDVTIVKLLGGGSLIIAYPALLAIRRLPHVKRLRLLASPSTRRFGEMLGIFDEVIVLRDNNVLSLARDSIKTIVRLWRTDMMIDLEIHSRLTTLFCLLTCARNRIGFYTQESFWRKGISTHLFFCQLSSGVYLFYDQIARFLGAKSASLRDAGAAFRTALGLPARVENRSKSGKVAIAACCSDLGRERMMLVSEWVEILRKRYGADCLPGEIHLLGGNRDRAYYEQLGAAIVAAWPTAKVLNRAAELKLDESVKLLAEMDELLSIDSSLLHFARLLGVKTVSYWGPTAPETRLRASDMASDEIHYEKLPCSPCVHIASATPCRGNNLCMRFAANPEFEGDRNPSWIIS
jgi:ADP-heptose:LPS heptosyltransferase